MDQTTVKPKTSPKDFFLHLLAMVALYVSAVSLTTVVFQLINLSVPDALDQHGYYTADSARRIIRSSLSFLIVFFPVYLYTSWHLHTTYLKDVVKRSLWIRRWLLYFTLFVAALINIFTLVSLVNHLLDGELTLRFCLKVLTIFFVAGSIFGYYLWDLKRDNVE
ncbi:MAG TPA: DUF5671 domain-containing protein [Candidatus Kapabacteria bacterium]|nr:DUF5671 domain-containing protein [Candidatus Kapabacteria bacterium]